jgi:hypothetical protein
MRTNLAVTFFFLMVLSFIVSCKKETEKISQINIPKFQDCYNSHPHDSATVANNLVGTWNWIEQSCMNSLTEASPSKVVKAIFTSTGIFTVIENASVISQGNWNVKIIGSNYFSVDS